MAIQDDIRPVSRKKKGLTALFVEKVRTPGRYGDGNGLMLVVDQSGASRWVLRVQTNGRRRDIGLGGTSVVSLSEARDLAHEIRRKAKAGLDPVAVRRAERQGVPTFEDCAKIVHAANLKTWRNGKHTDQWLNTLEAYAFPVIGKRPVNKVETGDILKILMPIWTDKAETARRVLQRLRTVLDHATAAGHRSGENPCRIAAIGLPKQGSSVKHFAALPYADLPAFLTKLRGADDHDPIIKLALEFLILTAARSGEVRGAPPLEFDLRAKLWTIPASRMKAEREHIVPLSPRAIEIIQEAQRLAPNAEFVFASKRTRGKPLSDMALTMLLRRLKVDATAHGFRSSFRDWCSEETDFPSEVAEMALAHAIDSKVEAAYRRGKLLEKRRSLMNAWAKYCGAKG
ncbi:site-specific integrase [Hyphomicrobium sp. MC1]|uniref:tyrosine-type recombinase/integrase n=1 Tax=Hyphomicrobium sp. (strain MC1) TaxID=717785 RepID=UPI000213E3E2|nr:site-specific integrase [Hyphomicrobium sp. MC1]CCB65248.1 Integrase family protein [Hyphomicrobium sp. MC1]